MDFIIMRITGGLWYQKYEGKVRLQWIQKICNIAGIDPDSLRVDEWHTIHLDLTVISNDPSD